MLTYTFCTTRQLDGFAVTYNTTDGQTTTVEHGSQFSSPAVIDLNREFFPAIWMWHPL